MDKDNEIIRFSYFDPPILRRDIIPTGARTVEDIFRIIKSEGLKMVTAEVRTYTDKSDRDKVKTKKLPYVTFAGTFSKRNKESLLHPSGLFAIDIDHVKDQLQDIRKAIRSEFQPALMFTSPSGDGLKIVCMIDPQLSYSSYFIAFQSFFYQHFSVSIDKQCSDISRACFICHDPDVYMSDNPTLFDKDFVDNTGANDYDEIFKRGKKSTERHYQFIDGERHIFITTLAGFLNRAGMPVGQAESRLLSFDRPGFDKQEIEGIVRRIYQKTDIHGTLPLNLNPGREAYTSFPLRLLWVPQDEFAERIGQILSDSYEHTTGDIPTSLKTSYLVDVKEGRIDPYLFLLLAAVKSIIGYHNYTRTTREFIFSRMFGDCPWRKYTKYFVDKLMKTAIERGMLVKIMTFPGFYVSISYSVDDLKRAVISNIDKRQKRLQKAVQAAREISQYKKELRTHNTKSLLKINNSILN